MSSEIETSHASTLLAVHHKVHRLSALLLPPVAQTAGFILTHANLGPVGVAHAPPAAASFLQANAPCFALAVRRLKSKVFLVAEQLMPGE